MRLRCQFSINCESRAMSIDVPWVLANEVVVEWLGLCDQNLLDKKGRLGCVFFFWPEGRMIIFIPWICALECVYIYFIYYKRRAIRALMFCPVRLCLRGTGLADPSL